MDCNKINRDDLIDRYIRDELSDQEADIFEEHLLYCSECRKELAGREEIINVIQKQAAGDMFKSGGQQKSFSKKGINIYWYVAAAAGIALVIGFFLLPDRNLPSGSSEIAFEENQTVTAKDLQLAADSTNGLFENSEEKTATIQETEPAFLAAYQKIASTHIFHVHFSKGLYYWQLTDDEETLHTGKILVR